MTTRSSNTTTTTTTTTTALAVAASATTGGDNYGNDDDDNDMDIAVPHRWDEQDLTMLLSNCDSVLRETDLLLQRASNVVGKQFHSIISAPPKGANQYTAAAASSLSNPMSSSTVQEIQETGGYSNTDHIIQLSSSSSTTTTTSNGRDDDFVAECRRMYLRRNRSNKPESRGDAKWDRQTKVLGSRRRRIVRDTDAANAPPEPPPSGYTLFLAQMTVKVRHDAMVNTPGMPHDQAKVMKKVSALWKQDSTDRKYYNDFAQEAQAEYKMMKVQYRATGRYRPSTKFQRLEDTNVWVKIPSDDNPDLIPLERELLSYDTVKFPLRPPEMDEAYREREKRSLFRRKMKDKGLLSEDGLTVDGKDFEEAFLRYEQERALGVIDHRRKPRKKRRKLVPLSDGTSPKKHVESNPKDGGKNDDEGDNDDNVRDGSESDPAPFTVATKQPVVRKPRTTVTVETGPPTEEIEGGWPDGWQQRISKRKSGATDRYFYTPIMKYRIRSIKDCVLFIKMLQECDGDEYAAWIKAGFKKRKT